VTGLAPILKSLKQGKPCVLPIVLLDQVRAQLREQTLLFRSPKEEEQ
jgi:hypothetical protein